MMYIGDVINEIDRDGGSFGLSFDTEAGNWTAQIDPGFLRAPTPSIARTAADAVRLAATSLGVSLADGGVDIGVLVDGMAREGGSFALHRGEDWMAMLVFGREDPDSPMAAGAAHGLGETADSAVQMVVQQTGWDRRAVS